jgi:hypothetical protein
MQKKKSCKKNLPTSRRGSSRGCRGKAYLKTAKARRWGIRQRFLRLNIFGAMPNKRKHEAEEGSEPDERWPPDICEQLRQHSFCVIRLSCDEAVRFAPPSPLKLHMS